MEEYSVSVSATEDKLDSYVLSAPRYGQSHKLDFRIHRFRKDSLWHWDDVEDITIYCG